MLASGTLKPSPSAIRISKLYQLSGHAVAPTAYRILCVRFTSFVRQPDTSGSAVGATLDTRGWLALARPGLSPGKMRQAYLGAVTYCSAAGRDDGGAGTALAARPQQQRVRPFYCMAGSLGSLRVQLDAKGLCNLQHSRKAWVPIGAKSPIQALTT